MLWVIANDSSKNDVIVDKLNNILTKKIQIRPRGGAVEPFHDFFSIGSLAPPGGQIAPIFHSPED